MPAGKLDAILTSPALEACTRLEFMEAPVDAFLALRMPALRFLSCNGLTSIPYDDLQNLAGLTSEHSRFVTLDLWRLPKLDSCYIGQSSQLVSLDAHGNTIIEEISASESSQLASVNVAGCTSLMSIWLSWCALPQAAVDQILADMVATGPAQGWGGQINLGYGNNQAPSATGQANKAILATRGYTIMTM